MAKKDTPAAQPKETVTDLQNTGATPAAQTKETIPAEPKKAAAVKKQAAKKKGAAKPNAPAQTKPATPPAQEKPATKAIEAPFPNDDVIYGDGSGQEWPARIIQPHHVLRADLVANGKGHPTVPHQSNAEPGQAYWRYEK